MEVKRGERVALIGENGGREINFALTHSVCFQSFPRGKCSSHGKIAALIELGSAFDPHINARENLKFYLALNGLSSAEIEAKKTWVESFADIGEFFEQPMRNLSSEWLFVSPLPALWPSTGTC